MNVHPDISLFFARGLVSLGLCRTCHMSLASDENVLYSVCSIDMILLMGRFSANYNSGQVYTQWVPFLHVVIRFDGLLYAGYKSKILPNESTATADLPTNMAIWHFPVIDPEARWFVLEWRVWLHRDIPGVGCDVVYLQTKTAWVRSWWYEQCFS